MINLLRGELYKLVRSRCFYICCITAVMFAFAMYGMFALADAVQRGTVVSDNIVVTSETGTVWQDMSVYSITQGLFSAAGVMLISVFTSIILYGDYANGAIKNVIGKGYGRIKVFFAKYLAAVAGSVMIECMMLFGVIICEWTILKGQRLNGDVLLSLCRYMGMQFLLGAALTGLFFAIGQICRNLGLSIAICMSLILFSSFLTAGVNILLNYLNISIDVSKYYVFDLIGECSAADMPQSFVVRGIVCAVAWVVVTMVTGGFHFRKVDVK